MFRISQGKYVIRLYQPDAAARRPTARKNKDAKNVVNAPAAGNGQWVHITVDDHLPTKCVTKTRLSLPWFDICVTPSGQMRD
jgi:hypothetical protein